MSMKRKQIYLDPGSDAGIKELAKTTGLSEAEHIRRAVAVYIHKMTRPTRAENEDPLLDLIGLCDGEDGPTDAALHHDRYLYGRRK